MQTNNIDLNDEAMAYLEESTKKGKTVQTMNF